MPLKLVPPRTGKSSNWRVRGTHLGVGVDKTTKTSERKLAAKVLAKIKYDIEAGKFAMPGAATFARAANAYLDAGGEDRFLLPLARHFGDKLLLDINQGAIDKAAATLLPDATAATRNRQVYTPVSAILRHAGIVIALRRPRGARGTRRTAWLEQDQAFALLAAASRHSERFGALVAFLLYTGARLNEALSLKWSDVDLAGQLVVIRQTKTEGVRTAFLPDPVMVALTGLAPKPEDRKAGSKVFGLAKNSRLYNTLNEVATKAGVEIPDRVAFHIFRHTWATWMRRHAGLDTAALVETGAWRSRQSASVYEHLDATEEAKKASMLPTPPDVLVARSKFEASDFEFGEEGTPALITRGVDNMVVEPFKIETESDADEYLADLLSRDEYRAMNEVRIRAIKYIHDEALRTYFVTKAKEILKTHGYEAE